MVKAKCTEAWDHTSALLALTINMNRGKSSHAVKAQELNPYRCAERKKPVVKLDKANSMKLLKSVFIDHKAPSLENIMAGQID